MHGWLCDLRLEFSKLLCAYDALINIPLILESLVKGVLEMLLALLSEIRNQLNSFVFVFSEIWTGNVWPRTVIKPFLIEEKLTSNWSNH